MDELAQTLELLQEGMDQAALGFGLGITNTPSASHEEIFHAFTTASHGISRGSGLRSAKKINGNTAGVSPIK